jgi:hypothetical protein
MSVLPLQIDSLLFCSSRSFMRSHMSESNVGLLLFDEPSASLDPATEHGESRRIFLPEIHTNDIIPWEDLFQRLRQLRGNKTMIFSSHRFGNLTRHADLILYVSSLLSLWQPSLTEPLAYIIVSCTMG